MLYLLNSILIPLKTKAADFEINPTIKSAHSEIIKTKLATGRAILEKDKTNNGLKIYLKSYADLIQLLITKDKIFHEQFIDNHNSRLEYLENLDKKSPYARMLQAEVHLRTAFVKLKFGHEVKGSWEIIKAYKLLEANTKEFPVFMPNQKSLGLLHILIGSTPENYQWVANLLGLKGNIKQGISDSTCRICCGWKEHPQRHKIFPPFAIAGTVAAGVLAFASTDCVSHGSGNSGSAGGGSRGPR